MEEDCMESVADRVVLVTGAGQGLGAAICEMLARDGAEVVAADIDADKADTVAARLRGEGGRVSPLRLDVADPAGIEAALDEAVAACGQLDAIVNNAGVDVTLPIDELTVVDWQRVLSTNLTGPFLMAKFGLARMAPEGHIVNIASTAARRAWPNACAYHASKWGLMGLSHALHAELRGRGIRVSAIIAGGMRTPFLLERFPDIDESLLQDPANVARAVRFVLTQPPGTVIPEVMVLPMKETSWP